MKTVKTLLSRSKNWIKGSNKKLIQTPNGKEYAYCLRGACIEAYGTPSNEYNDNVREAMNKVQRAIAKLKKKAFNRVSVINFNDSPKTKFKQIQQVIKLANV
jgi:hypothetical protein